MLYYTVDNTIYSDRKELKTKIGGANKYYRELREGKIIFIKDNVLNKLQISSGAKTKIHSDYEDRQKLHDTCISK